MNEIKLQEKKHHQPRKEWVPEHIRLIISNEIRTIVNERSGEFSELKSALEPVRLKSEINKMAREQMRLVFSEEVSEVVSKQMIILKNQIYNLINNEAKLLLKEKIDNFDINFQTKIFLEKSLQNNFEKIIKTSLKLCGQSIRNEINKHLKKIINLKTSSIIEVQDNIRNFSSEKDEKIYSDLQKLKYEGDKRYLEWFENAK